MFRSRLAWQSVPRTGSWRSAPPEPRLPARCCRSDGERRFRPASCPSASVIPSRARPFSRKRVGRHHADHCGILDGGLGIGRWQTRGDSHEAELDETPRAAGNAHGRGKHARGRPEDLPRCGSTTAHHRRHVRRPRPRILRPQPDADPESLGRRGNSRARPGRHADRDELQQHLDLLRRLALRTWRDRQLIFRSIDRHRRVHGGCEPRPGADGF